MTVRPYRFAPKFFNSLRDRIGRLRWFFCQPHGILVQFFLVDPLIGGRTLLLSTPSLERDQSNHPWLYASRGRKQHKHSHHRDSRSIPGYLFVNGHLAPLLALNVASRTEYCGVN